LVYAPGAAAQFAPDQPKTPNIKAVGAEWINRSPKCRPARVEVFGPSRDVVVLAFCTDPDVDPMIVVAARANAEGVTLSLNDDQSVKVSGLDPGAEVKLEVDVLDLRRKGTKAHLVVFRSQS
jgi:hypothetical protein